MEPPDNPAAISRMRQLVGIFRPPANLSFSSPFASGGKSCGSDSCGKYLKVSATVFVIGLFDGLRTLLGAIYAYPGGLLVDRWGHRRAFITFNVISIVGYAIVLLVPHWGAVIVGMFLFLSWTCFSLPATFSLVAETLAANRYAMGIGVQSVIKRCADNDRADLRRHVDRPLRIIVGVRIGLIVDPSFGRHYFGAAKTGGRSQACCGGGRPLESLA
jgi:hypothetical protein